MDLVTGGTGLVGSHLIYSLVKEGRKVRALKRKTSDLSWVENLFLFYDAEAGNELLHDIEWVDADVNDPNSLEQVFQGVENVFHAAAMVSFDPRDRKKLLRVNRDGTRNMVNLALDHNVSHFNYVSSVAALGVQYKNGAYYVNEHEKWKNSEERADYSVSKFFAEMEVWRASEEGLSVSIVNPTVILGPCNWYKGSGAIFRRVSRGLPFYPTGSTGFVDVRDVVQVIRMLSSGKYAGERFLVSSENLTYKEMLSMIASSFGKKTPRYPVTRCMGNMVWRLDKMASRCFGKPHEVTRLSVRSGERKVYYDTANIKNRLDYGFIPVADAIENAVSFYRKMVIRN